MKHDLNNKNFERKAKRVYSVFACVALLLVATAVPALAADDPLRFVLRCNGVQFPDTLKKEP